jgi:hypothetical protein
MQQYLRAHLYINEPPIEAIEMGSKETKKESREGETMYDILVSWVLCRDCLVFHDIVCLR